MPELPEVEIVVRELNRWLMGSVIDSIHLFQTVLRRLSLPQDLSIFKGLVIKYFVRIGKYIIIHFEQVSDVFLIHLGMAGVLSVQEHFAHPNKHDIFRIDFGFGKSLVFSDVRRFGQVAFLAAEELLVFRKKLAPDPFSDSWSDLAFFKLLSSKNSLVKTLLLDQQQISGIGNIYAGEALFDSGIYPARISKSLSKVEAERLLLSIRKVLSLGLQQGGASFRDYVHTDGSAGLYQNFCKVYGRKGLSCLTLNCQKPISVMKIAGRSTYYCSGCQPSPAG